ncbi:hypothetical protein T265_09021 [Opisthorchis viverrini]|uniref:Uncharacterized protein n=1 Tax=Opisthorchis viverrini TaxID=6198 RepID=A0A074ZBM8_OPIVI|nr:hypothetical protein T265_09021 [Opisthorchis viverrini]KER23012.1 hypothetical protein T265_09021 [Opisthorchis viverrini]
MDVISTTTPVRILAPHFESELPTISLSSKEKMKDSELLSLLGLKLALENQANQQSSSNASLSIPETMQQWQPGLDRGGLDPDEPMPKAATHINLQEFGDSYILTCKTNPTHSVHSIYLSCPMMPIGCFENCKRICEPTGCVREAGLRNVVCHAVHYSEQQGSVRQFEYKMNKYDKNITGKWSCFHAGVRSQIINVEAVPLPTTTSTTTTTTTTTVTSSTRTPTTSARTMKSTSSDPYNQARTSELSQHSGTNRFQFVHSRFWSDERLNSMPKQQPTNKTTAVSQRSVSGWSTMPQNETRGQQYSSLIGKRLYYVHPTGIHQREVIKAHRRKNLKASLYQRARWLNWLERESTNWKVRGSNPTWAY